MTLDEMLDWDASSILPLLRDGSLSAREYAEALVGRADAHKDLHAFCSIHSETLIRSAIAADETPRHERGVLHGLPLVIKDNINVAGMPCSAASPAFIGNVPREDAECIARVRRAGALPFGRANMHELALGVTSNNAAFGAVRNPYDRGRAAGGSSGGNAAAVSARLAPAGIGTDTGGSIRIPAALCGVVGFRPTTGRWPRNGIIPVSMPSRDTPAPMARSVADCALIDAVVTGESSRPDEFLERPIRLGIVETAWKDTLPALVDQVHLAMALLHENGVKIVEIKPPLEFDYINELGLTIALAENLPTLAAYCTEHRLDFDLERFSAQVASPDVRSVVSLLQSDAAPTQETYLAALREVRDSARPRWLEAMANANVDALVMPTTPFPAPRLQGDESVAFAGRLWPTFPTYVRYCGAASVFGQPSISLPIGTIDHEATHLPVGLQLDGAPGTDRQLLAIAAHVAPFLPKTPAPK